MIQVAVCRQGDEYHMSGVVGVYETSAVQQSKQPGVT